MPTRQALQLAIDKNLDLVEVAPTAVPPVCRLLNYGKYRFEQTKKERESRRAHKISEVRQIRLRPKIDGHDVEAKIRSIKKLLGEGDKVKVTVLFRGREVTHPDIAFKLLQKIADSLTAEAIVERRQSMEGKMMTMIFAPALGQPPAKPEGKPEPKAETKPETKAEIKITTRAEAKAQSEKKPEVLDAKT